MKKNRSTNLYWFIYIAQCKDDTLYTGITKDVDRRILEHNVTNKCKYTRSRRPVTLAYSERCHSHSAALKREVRIKKFSRKRKISLIGKFS